MSERVLSTRELNRALLERQALSNRSPNDIPAVLEAVGGIQAQYAPSAYIGLWTRVAGFRREQLTAALVHRHVVQATLMRSTIHLVSAADYWLLAAGIRRHRREWWERTRQRDLTGVDMGAAGDLVRRALADGPRSHRELAGALAAEGFPPVAWAGVGAYVDLVRAPPSGTWVRRRADLYALAETWLGPCDATEEDGVEHVVRRYLGGFGPATVADVASWAQLPVRILRPVVERLGTVRYRDQRGATLFDLPAARPPDDDTPAPPRYLPTWDATLLVHARRAAILPEGYRPKVFSTRNPQSLPTFLVDGAVRGSWRYADGRIDRQPFERLSAAGTRALDAEAVDLVTLHDE